jgi:hypothetical protein
LYAVMSRPTGLSSLTCVTIIDTIILHIHTKDAYSYDTYDAYLHHDGG